MHAALPNTHPRRAGTRARSLRVAREQGLDLSRIIAGLSSNAAVHLGKTGLKAMQERGRLQKDMVADIVIFNAETVTDNASYADGLSLSTGIVHVLVNGQMALESGEIVEATKAGQPIRFVPTGDAS